MEDIYDCSIHVLQCLPVSFIPKWVCISGFGAHVGLFLETGAPKRSKELESLHFTYDPLADVSLSSLAVIQNYFS